MNPSSCNSRPAIRHVGRVFRAIAALILLQTLWYKFTGAPESKFIFATLGVEPWGRVATGMLELLACLLLARHRYAVFGALLSAGLMGGAVMSHLTRLGIVVRGDGGLLFGLALTVLGSSLAVLWLRRGEIPFIGGHLAPRCAAVALKDGEAV